MKNSIMNYQSVLAGDNQMDLLPNLEDGNLVVPSIERRTKPECVQNNEPDLKERNGILGFFLKILLPKSIATTPPPDRQIYY